MPKLKPLPPKELIKLLENIGFKFASQKGSHAKYKHDDGRTVIVPIHASKEIDRGLLLKIIKKELRMTREEFEKLLD